MDKVGVASPISLDMGGTRCCILLVLSGAGPGLPMWVVLSNWAVTAWLRARRARARLLNRMLAVDGTWKLQREINGDSMLK